MSATEHDLAAAIYARITSDIATDNALGLWAELDEFEPRERMQHFLAMLAACCIGEVLFERQREAARTGPWESSAGLVYREVMDGPQEEDGYPGSLLPPKRGAP